MTLVPRQSLFNLDNWFDDFWSPLRGTSEISASTFVPRVDVADKKDRLEITAELPGVNKDDIEVTLDSGILTLSAESRQEHKDEQDGEIIRQERRYGKYLRSFNVGPDVKESDIEANFDNGVLKVTAPKAEPQQPETKRIEIH